MRNVPTGEYATCKKEYAIASPPTTTFLQAATGEAMRVTLPFVSGGMIATGSSTMT